MQDRLYYLDRQMQVLLKDSNINKVIIKKAQSQGFLNGVIDAIKTKFSPMLEGKNKAEIIGIVLDVIIPALSWMLGFKKFSILLDIAEALGFDFNSLFSLIKDKLGNYLNGLNGAPAQASAIENIVNSSITESASGGTDTSSLFDTLKNSILKSGFISKKEILVRNILADENQYLLIKEAGLLNKLKGGVFSFIGKLILYCIMGVLITAGLTKVSKDLGVSDTLSPTKPNLPKVDVHINTNLPEELTKEHYEDVWTLPFPISQLSSKLKEWAAQIYNFTPEECEQSTKFQRVLNLFKDRNKGGISSATAVPNLYKSIMDIVDDFAADVAEKKKTA